MPMHQAMAMTPLLPIGAPSSSPRIKEASSDDQQPSTNLGQRNEQQHEDRQTHHLSHASQSRKIA
jgi:hypothetical protein